MGFLTGKRALIVGVASKLSIASGIAAAMHREGAELAFTYQNDKLRGRVEEFASGWGSRPELCFPCDVADDSQIEAVFAALGKHWDGLDIIVHSVGFAPGDQLDGDFTAVTTREGFRIAHDISAYSFIALAKAGREMMKGRNGSLLTLSYLGAERTMPNYNVMGMAKASLEAGSATWPAAWARKAPGSMRFPPGRSERSPPPESRASARCWPPTSGRRRCGATSPSRKSAMPAPSSVQTWPAVSVARYSTSMAASTLPPWARWTTTDHPAHEKWPLRAAIFHGRNKEKAA